MSQKYSNEDATSVEDLPLISSTSEKEGIHADIESFCSNEGSSSNDSLEKADDTNRRLPPSLKAVIHKEVKNTLLDIHKELKVFIAFVENIQKEAPIEWEVVTVTPLQTETESKPSPPANEKDDSARDLFDVDARPKNAPIRDAFQIVRNLLSKITTLIDKLASTTAISDDSSMHECSPQYSIYYAQHVFQISCFVFKMIGEHLNKFSNKLGETSENDPFDKLPDTDHHSIRQHSHLHRKDSGFCVTNNNEFKSSQNVQENNSRNKNVENIQNDLRKRIYDGLELLKFLAERMLSTQEIQLLQFSNFNMNQNPPEKLTRTINVEDKSTRDLGKNRFSRLLKEELNKNLKEFSETSSYPDSVTIVNLIIQSFREITQDEEFESGIETKVAGPSQKNKAKHLDDVLDIFVEETYKFAAMSLLESKEASLDVTKRLKKSETVPFRGMFGAQKVILKGSPKSFPEVCHPTGKEIKKCSCPRAIQVKISDYIKKSPKNLFSLYDFNNTSKRSECDDECLRARILHEHHDLLPKGKMEVRQVNERGHVVVTLEDYESGSAKNLINCPALINLREGKSRADLSPALKSTNMLKALRANLRSSRKVKDLSITSSHSRLIPVKYIGSSIHEEGCLDISEIVEKMYDFGVNLKNAGYGTGPPLILKIRCEKVFEETFKVLIVPSGIPLSYYKKIYFHMYESSNPDEVEDLTDEMFPILGEKFFCSRDEGLFDYPSTSSMFVYPNPASTSPLEWFRFAGILLAVALYQNEFLGVKLPLCFYKCLLDRPLILHDLKEIDPALHAQLIWINENDLSNQPNRFRFTIREKVGKEFIVTELVDGGREVSVMENNKMLFIDKCFKRKLVERRLIQFNEILIGFTSVLEPRFLDEYEVKEIQNMIEKCPCLSKNEINEKKKGYSQDTFSRKKRSEILVI